MILLVRYTLGEVDVINIFKSTRNRNCSWLLMRCLVMLKIVLDLHQYLFPVFFILLVQSQCNHHYLVSGIMLKYFIFYIQEHIKPIDISHSGELF